MKIEDFKKQCYEAFQLYGSNASSWEGTRELEVKDPPHPRRKRAR